jgi:hypothetical protein
MKKLVLSFVYLLIAVSLAAQAKFDLGVKGGVNFSKLSFDKEDYNAESVTKSHFGAFGRIGWDRVFIQPEIYYSGRGVDVNSATNTLSSLDFKTVDVPVLLGVSLIKGKLVDFHLIGGPVFSGITSKSIEGDAFKNRSFYEDYYFGLQYGLGIDILFFTLDARMENSLGDCYSGPNVAGKNQSFMVSLGFKLF